jgi:hypothetical protein
LLLDGHEPEEPIYYHVSRVIKASTIRRNLAYQGYLFKRYHSEKYSLNLFFRYELDLNGKHTPFIIEIGFNMYFLLREFEEHFRFDMNEDYF